MKRIIPIAILFLFVALASCRKRYSCACDINMPGYNYTPRHVEYYLGKVSKADAERECQGKQTAIYNYSYTCRLN